MDSYNDKQNSLGIAYIVLSCLTIVVTIGGVLLSGLLALYQKIKYVWLSRQRPKIAQKAPEEPITQESSPDNKETEEVKVDNTELKHEIIEGEDTDLNGRPLKSVKKQSKKIYESALTVI